MDDGSRNRRSQESTIVAPGVHTTTMNASVLERGVECGETGHLGAGPLRAYRPLTSVPYGTPASQCGIEIPRS